MNDYTSNNSLNKVLSNIQNWIYVSNVSNEGSSGIESKTKKLVSAETFKENLVSDFNDFGFTTECATVNRDGDAGIMNQAKYLSFNLYAKAMEVKRGNANVTYAWYVGTKDELKTILSNGFIYPLGMLRNVFGAHLSPNNRSPLKVQLADDDDEDGFKHMLLCRVILGNTEVVVAGQYKPSSEEFDTGVDSLESPNKYIIWNTNVNTHILPEFMISFRAPSHNRGHNRGYFRTSKPRSTHIGNIIKELTKRLPADAIESISKHHSEYNKGTITSIELVQRMKLIAGSELFRKAVIACLEKLRGKKCHTNRKDSEFVSELVSQFSSQLKIKSREEQ